MKKVVMSLSGGVDSSTLLGHMLNEGYDVVCIHVQYGSKHNSYELKAARDVANFYGVELIEFDISNITSKFKSNLLKGGGEIPEGYYAQDNMSLTVVPMRNVLFLSIAAGVAWSIDAQFVALGIHQGDHPIYPDCRKEFYKAMDTAVYLASDGRVEFIAPFVGLDKAGIVSVGLKLGVPYHLTRTCYKDQPISCGRCGACVERLEAFYKNNAVDPIEYEDTEFWKKVIEVEKK